MTSDEPTEQERAREAAAQRLARKLEAITGLQDPLKWSREYWDELGEEWRHVPRTTTFRHDPPNLDAIARGVPHAREQLAAKLRARSTAGQRCERTDLLVDQCAHCRTATRPPRPSQAAASAYGPWTTARYDGRCSGPCDDSFYAGDEIRADGEGGWLCATCGTDDYA